MAISMVIRMRRYYTTRIAQWRRSRAFIKATKHRHQASTCSDSINWSPPPIASIGHSNAGCIVDFIVKKGLS